MQYSQLVSAEASFDDEESGAQADLNGPKPKVTVTETAENVVQSIESGKLLKRQ